MINKKINYFFVILTIICMYWLTFLATVKIIDVSTIDVEVIMPLDSLISYMIGVINIILGILNKENKKLCFWQIASGLLCIGSGTTVFFIYFPNIINGLNLIITAIIPIILAIKNLAMMNKNNLNVIQIILYVVVFIIGILRLLIHIVVPWVEISIVMQLIYIHKQEEIVEK